MRPRGSYKGQEAFIRPAAPHLITRLSRRRIRCRFLTFARHPRRGNAGHHGVFQSPRTVFVRQANIAAGPQQDNNGAGGVARAETVESPPIKLLEATQDGERVDGGTTTAAGGGNPSLAAVDAVNRPRTDAGKARSSRNAFRGGEHQRYRLLARELRTVLGDHRKMLQDLSL
jgi:hypothetical protein